MNCASCSLQIETVIGTFTLVSCLALDVADKLKTESSSTNHTVSIHSCPNLCHRWYLRRSRATQMETCCRRRKEVDQLTHRHWEYQQEEAWRTGSARKRPSMQCDALSNWSVKYARDPRSKNHSEKLKRWLHSEFGDELLLDEFERCKPSLQVWLLWFMIVC